ncbi:unnamed protein product [Paramecium sonneborni]|uniref:Uncharacterized protein n=1 Tax=Paramecium sonneborni TaxID=65129 RepID=A0A8S1KFT8_9CILI|nr:unnamed protein product [Paramecium sonneborni]
MTLNLKIAYYMYQDSIEIKSLQQTYDSAIIQSEQMIEVMKEKPKEHFIKLGVDLDDISNLFEHFANKDTDNQKKLLLIKISEK